MPRPLLFVVAALALSASAFAQPPATFPQDGYYQIGYAANLNIGDSALNFSNDGAVAGFTAPLGAGNLCVNVYVFDPQEEEISCCSCLTTPNGLGSLSAKNDLINNTLTPAVPNSIVISLVGSKPAADVTNNLTVCNPATVTTGALANGMLAWGTTVEPAPSAGTYTTVSVAYRNGTLNTTGTPSELTSLTSTCSFIQANGSGFGLCDPCRDGGLGGAKN